MGYTDSVDFIFFILATGITSKWLTSVRLRITGSIVMDLSIKNVLLLMCSLMPLRTTFSSPSPSIISSKSHLSMFHSCARVPIDFAYWILIPTLYSAQRALYHELLASPWERLACRFSWDRSFAKSSICDLPSTSYLATSTGKILGALWCSRSND